MFGCFCVFLMMLVKGLGVFGLVGGWVVWVGLFGVEVVLLGVGGVWVWVIVVSVSKVVVVNVVWDIEFMGGMVWGWRKGRYCGGW